MSEISGMNDYAQAFRAVGKESLVGNLSESHSQKEAHLNILRSFGLPLFGTAALPLNEFLLHPAATLSEISVLNTGQYQVSLTSTIPDKPRLNKFPLSAVEVLDFIHDDIEEANIPSWSILIREIAENICGATIVCAYDGTIYIETAPGNHSKLAHAKVIPAVYEMDINDNLKVIRKYKEESPETLDNKYATTENMEQYLLRTISLVPKDQSFQSISIHHVGYYEVVLIHDPEGRQMLIPVFLDYQEGLEFQIKQPAVNQQNTVAIRATIEKDAGENLGGRFDYMYALALPLEKVDQKSCAAAASYVKNRFRGE